MSEFVTTTTVLTGLAVGAANCYLSQHSGAFATGLSHRPAVNHEQARSGNYAGPVSALNETFGAKGLVGFGTAFGVLAAAAQGVGRASRRRVVRKAAEIDVAEKTEGTVVPYFESLPRSIVDKRTLDKLLSTVPKEQWEDPPENSYLYTLKCYAETYGEGKSTKMGWWDFWYLRVNAPDADDFISGQYEVFETSYALKVMKEGAFPMEVPGPASSLPVGAWMKWRGAEPFAGDQCRTPVSAGGFAMQFLDNLAFYREGLKPWQRGLEIGMAHGYFIIGPFVSTGPLRNTPEAATVGLLCGCAIIGIVSVGGLIFGSTVKPTRFDKPGDAPAAGYQEMINWHALGGLGGAGFAHALITIFGS